MNAYVINDPLTVALARAHAKLLDDVAKLDDAARPQACVSVPELRARLAKAQGDVAEHFRIEEQGGYLEVVRKREPRLAATIDELAADHRRLTASLETITAEVPESPAADGSFRARVREWIRELKRHELRENELVQDAFNDDVGVED